MTTVGRIHLVLVPTTDPDRSIAFYESLGFAKRADFPFGDGSRWIELFPPDGCAAIALSGVERRARSGSTRGCWSPSPTSRRRTPSRRRSAAHPTPLAHARARDVTSALGGATVTGPTPSMFRVRDPDGNALLIIGD